MLNYKIIYKEIDWAKERQKQVEMHTIAAPVQVCGSRRVTAIAAVWVGADEGWRRHAPNWVSKMKTRQMKISVSLV